MSRKHLWNETVDKVKMRLSKWKMNTLSIGGRLTLIKSVLSSTPLYHFSIFNAPAGVLNYIESLRSHFFNGHDIKSKKTSWVNWKNALVAKDRGGLGISSLYAMNRGLLWPEILLDEHYPRGFLLVRNCLILAFVPHSAETLEVVM
ncbi:hypothetical protein Tco_1574124, partial [Tanacetum coccineum]